MKWIGLFITLIFYIPSLHATFQLQTEQKIVDTDSFEFKVILKYWYII